MKRMILVIAIASVAMWTSVFAADGSGGINLVPNPDWCRPGFRCLKIGEYGEMTVRKIELERDLALARARSRRFGFSLGCGPGVAAIVRDDYHINVVPTPFECGLKFGWRFR